MRTFFVAIMLWLCIAFSVQSQAQLVNASQLDLSSLRDANAVVRKDSLVVDFQDIDHMTIYKYRVVTVLNAKGNKAVNAHSGYDNDYTIKNIQAELYDANGQRIKKIKERDFKDVSANDGFSLYNDYRYKYLDYKPTSYPYTIAFSLEVKTKNTAFLPTYYFVKEYGVKVESASYTINYNKNNYPLRFKQLNVKGLNLHKIEKEEGVSFYANDIDIYKDEALSPDYSTYFPKIMTMSPIFNLGGYKGRNITTWAELGAWFYNNLLKNRADLSETTIQKVKALTEGIEDPIEKAKIIYKYVQNNTRYVSVQIGIGGMQPIRASDVDNMKYGDCKGLSNYTKALLEAVGVTSYYTHVEAGKYKVSFEDNFATIAQGNHVILSIPSENKNYWIDCTSKSAPFNFLGDFTDDRKVLVMKPDGGEIVTTPAYLNEQNFQNTSAKVNLEENGDISIIGTTITGGIQYNSHSYLQGLSPIELKKRDLKYWHSLQNLTINEHTFEKNKDSILFKENFQLTGENYGKKVGNRIILSLNALNQKTAVPQRYRNRENPFQISRGYRDFDKLTYILPENYSVEALPKNEVIESEFGKYEMNISQQDNQLVYQRTLLIKAGDYEKEKYEAYRNFRKQIAYLENAKISILKNK